MMVSLLFLSLFLILGLTMIGYRRLREGQGRKEIERKEGNDG